MIRCPTCGYKQRVRRRCYRCAGRASYVSGWEREPSAEEVEAVIAEQLACLPPWWSRACPFMEGHTLTPKLFAREAPRGRHNGNPL